MSADLNARIARWRAVLDAGEILTDEQLDELESHLRDEHEALAAAGLADDEAFLIAARRLGRHDELDAEFGKLQRGTLGRRGRLLVLGAGLGLLGVQLAKSIGHVGQLVALDARNHWVQLAGVWVGALLTLAAVVWVARFVMGRDGARASRLSGWLWRVRGARWGGLRVAGLVLLATLAVQFVTYSTEVLATSGMTAVFTPAEYGQLAMVKLFSDVLLAALAPALLVLAALGRGGQRQAA